MTRDSRGAVHSTAIVGASLAVWSIGAYFFYLLAGRLLGPEDYGLAAALQAVIVAIALPAIALQWAVARSIASAGPAERAGARAVYRRAVVRGITFAIAGAALATVITLIIGGVRAGTPVGPLVATYWAAAPIIPLVLGMGALQGEHRYWGFAGTYGSTGVLRAPFLVLLLAIPIIGSVEATSIATGIPYLLAAVIVLWLTRTDLRVSTAPPPAMWRAFTHSLIAAGVGLGGIAVLTNVDVVAAKVGIGGKEAGYFGATAIVAKALMVIPQALTVVLLPRVAERESRGNATGPLLAAGVAVMFAAGILAMLIAIPLADPIITITFGQAYAPAASLVVPFFGATTLLGALLILVNHHVARSDHRFVWVTGGLAIVQVVLLIFFSGTERSIIAVDAVVAGLGLVIHELIYFRTDESMVRGVGRELRSVIARLRTRGGTT
jgi:O-antigen/teichoic acid export membrane protein